MGISGITALTIRNRDDLIVTHGGPGKKGSECEGKYVGWIMLPEDRWAPLLNTEPVFDTAEEAEAHMRDIIKQVREADLPTTLAEFEQAGKKEADDGSA